MVVRMSVDPGITGTGIAVWNAKDWGAVVPPVTTTILNPSSKHDGYWERKLNDVASKFLSYLRNYEASVVYCEWPEYFDSASGHMTAAKGDLGKLYGVAGAFWGICLAQGVLFTPVKVQAWKGQLPKEVVERRIKSILGWGEGRAKSHEWDAIGLGLWAKGQLNVRERTH